MFVYLLSMKVELPSSETPFTKYLILKLNHD